MHVITKNNTGAWASEEIAANYARAYFRNLLMIMGWVGSQRAKTFWRAVANLHLRSCWMRCRNECWRIEVAQCVASLIQMYVFESAVHWLKRARMKISVHLCPATFVYFENLGTPWIFLWRN